MTTFSAADLAGMRTAQEAHMMDTCVIQAVVQTLDSMRELVETWPVDGDALACGLDMRPGTERHGVDNVILKYDGTIRLPITTVVDVRDRIKVTKRFGEDVEFVEATTNLITNPSFEVNTVGWTGSLATIARATTDSVFGSACKSIIATATNGRNEITLTGIPSLTTYTLSVYAKISDGESRDLEAYDIANAVVAGRAAIVGTGDWKRYSVSFITGALSTNLLIRLIDRTVLGWTMWYEDGWQLEQKSSSTRYCDGSLGKGHSWAGTVHASVSSRAQELLIYEVAGPIQRGPSGIRVMLNRIET